MKKILITGVNSYIGTSFKKYMEQWPEKYQVDTISLRDGKWKEKSFSGYDAVCHVAGIAHIKESDSNAHLYYEVNRDLAIETAKKSKADGVLQFVFLSTMAVYGKNSGKITTETLPEPVSNYGKSKLEAENGIRALSSDQFSVAILRPPMVYGDGCKGNYQALVKLAMIAPVFPAYINQRSMVHIDRLSRYIKAVIDTNYDGLVFPQDREYICTCKMVQEIAERNGKRLPLLKLLNPLVFLAKEFTTAGKKAFGDLYYDISNAFDEGEGEWKL